jgi:hypothetical protein
MDNLSTSLTLAIIKKLNEDTRSNEETLNIILESSWCDTCPAGNHDNLPPSKEDLNPPKEKMICHKHCEKYGLIGKQFTQVFDLCKSLQETQTH